MSDQKMHPVDRLAQALEDSQGTMMVGTWKNTLLKMCESESVSIVESGGPVPAACNPEMPAVAGVADTEIVRIVFAEITRAGSSLRSEVSRIVADNIQRNGVVSRTLQKEIRQPGDLRTAILAEVRDDADAEAS